MQNSQAPGNDPYCYCDFCSEPASWWSGDIHETIYACDDHKEDLERAITAYSMVFPVASVKRISMTKKELIESLPETLDCPCCIKQVMTKEEPGSQYYDCPNGCRVWADPIGEGLVRYTIMGRKNEKTVAP